MLERRGVDGYYCSRSRIRAALLRDRSALLRVTSGYFGLLRVTLQETTTKLSYRKSAVKPALVRVQNMLLAVTRLTSWARTYW